MLVKTRGIMLRFTRYGDTSIIASAFTERNGLQSFLVKGVRSPRAHARMALFQPLTIVDLVIYQRDSANLQHIREVRCHYPYRNIHGDVLRETIAFFLTELLNRSLREQTETEAMYTFLESELMRLDQITAGLECFHLEFMLMLSRQLGFGPQTPEEILGGRVVPPEVRSAVALLLEGRTRELTLDQRRDVLGILAEFFRDHIGNFGNLRSVEVLREILR